MNPLTHWMRGRGRRAVACWSLFLTLVLSASFALATPGPAAARSDTVRAAVEPAVLQEIEAKGEATFWVYFGAEANLAAAYTIQDWAARGQFVYESLRKTAVDSQAGATTYLEKLGVPYQAFWIANVIKVTGGREVLMDLAALPGVSEIAADRVYSLVEPEEAKPEEQVGTVEWGLANIRADQVWADFGILGGGIVVASIDTGVMFNHPALVDQYRGNLGGGNFDHNYNWHDPSRICGNPSLVPCDNNGHGTHVHGTMVGWDGGDNQIGVAPEARWIAAKGCETSSCSQSALLSSGQFILAPTDLSGQNPRPDLRPHVVNNSWGGGATTDPWYRATVQAWVAAGIFPQFANGNAGPSCGSAGNPGNLPESYAAGAYNISNQIASFSSRGPSAWGGIKPNIAAPGVSVRSAWNNGGYNTISGTSMASPHVAGTVALMLSGAPSLVGDIAGIRALLDQTAIDTSDLSCGGTPENNNVWGEGRLDAYAAVDQSPRGPTGTLAGTVTDAGTGSPIAGARVEVTGEVDRAALTDPSGQYSLTLPVGSYDMTVTAFGYVSGGAGGVEVLEGETTTRDFALAAAPSGSLSGVVRDNFGSPIPGATVRILGTPIPAATAGENGSYSFPSVPEGTYSVRAEAGRCNDPQTQPVTLAGDTTLDFALPLRTDAFGYFCQLVDEPFEEADPVLPITGDDTWGAVSLPFPFPFYGQTYTTAFVCTNGFIGFVAGNCPFSNSAIPSPGIPNGAIYPYWDDLFVDSPTATIRGELKGEAPNRRFVVEFRNLRFFGDLSRRVDFNVVLHENGRILTQYRNIQEGDGREMGNSATVGIEDHTGTIALQYSFNEAVLSSGLSILYRLPPMGFVEGTVTDANDGLPLAGTAVTFSQGGSPVRSAVTGDDGFYRVQLPLGAYSVEASKANYASATAEVTLGTEDEVLEQSFSLTTALAEVSPAALEFLVTAGGSQTQTLVLSNVRGTEILEWRLFESGGGRVGTSSTALLEKNPDYDPDAMTTEGLYLGGTPPGWSPTAPGDIIRSWAPTGLSLAWGVGHDGNVWLSDVPAARRNHEFTVEGAATGRNWPTPWAGSWPGDMAYDAGRGIVCQVNVGGDNGIYCWDRNTGNVVDSITGSFPWTTISQRGLAYRADTDSFYIGGWNQGILYHVKGLSHPDKGAVISQCNPPDGNISGLAWNPAAGIVWIATNSPTDTIYRVDPTTCAVQGTLAHPTPGFNGAGLHMDEEGNLWMISQANSGAQNRVYLMESGVPAFVDVPWLAAAPTSGSVAAGGIQAIAVSVNAAGLEPGVYAATLHFQTNSGRQPNFAVPVSLIVTAYRQGVNAGGDAYTDTDGDVWAADQAYTEGGWGYVNRSRTSSTRRDIAGTDDDPLYRSAREQMNEYRFDGLAPGVYQVELRFADLLQNQRPGRRMFDVIIEGAMVLPAYDIAANVGPLAADDHTFYLMLTDGQLNIRLVTRRGYGDPIINGIRVTHRPDR